MCLTYVLHRYDEGFWQALPPGEHPGAEKKALLNKLNKEREFEHMFSPAIKPPLEVKAGR